MSDCIVTGEGDVKKFILKDNAKNGFELFDVFPHADGVEEDKTPQLRGLPELLDIIRKRSITKVSFLGKFDQWTGDMGTRDMLAVFKKPPDFDTESLIGLIYSELEKEGAEIVPITHYIPSLRPEGSNLVWDTIETKDVYNRVKRQLDWMKTDQGEAWPTAALATVHGINHFAKKGEGCTDFLNRIGSNTLEPGIRSYLVRYSPWDNYAVRMPTFGPETIIQCRELGIAGLLSEKGKTLALAREEALQLTRSTQYEGKFHLEFF